MLDIYTVCFTLLYRYTVNFITRSCDCVSKIERHYTEHSKNTCNYVKGIIPHSRVIYYSHLQEDDFDCFYYFLSSLVMQI